MRLASALADARPEVERAVPDSVGRAVPACPFCECDRVATRYDFGRERILRCRGCGLMYLHPWPSEEETRAVYGDSYFQNGELLKGESSSLFGYTDYIAERFNKQQQYAGIVREIRARLVRSTPPRLLEVGCGFGYFLDVAFEE